MEALINSFKKDEIYTFLFGLVVSGVWLKFLNKLSFDKFVSDKTIILIFAWLVITGLLYLCYLVVAFLFTITALFKKGAGRDNPEILFKSLKRGTNKVFYRKDIEGGDLHTHLVGLFLVSLVAILIPLFNYVSLYIPEQYKLFIVFYIIIIFFLNYAFYVMCDVNTTRARLVDLGFCLVMDNKVFEEKISVLMAQKYYKELHNTSE